MNAENLNALISGRDISAYQRALAYNEARKLIEQLSNHEEAMREKDETAQSIITSQAIRLERAESENTKLRELLSEIADDMERDYNNKYQAVIEHNNLDGVGISFDYRSNPKKPKYLQEIRETINKPIA